MAGARDSDSERLHLSFRGREHVNSLQRAKKSMYGICSNPRCFVSAEAKEGVQVHW